MASKQLGKLRQWAGEVMASKEKTLLPEDFIQLEREVEMTRHGLETLQVASSNYHAHISQKVVTDGVRGEDKLMHDEALGVVMANYGEELGDDSEFGKSLISYGRAKSRVAAIQETYAVHLMEAFINHLNRSLVELEEYSGLRKKLDSRRLALDAAISKAEKTYKKEKDKKEAQDELEKAQLRYEKVCEDVQFRMDTIKANEAVHLEELTSLLDSETTFVEEYLSILKGIRAEWPEGRDSRKTPRASTFNRSASSATERDPKPPSSSRFSSYKSGKTNGSHRSLPSDWHSSDSEEEKPPTRPSSRLSKKSGKVEPPSRPQSRQSRKRHDSVATTASFTADEIEQPRPVKPRRKSMVSSLGDAVSNVMSRGKGRDKENFAALQDNDAEIERPRSSMSTRSGRSGKSHGDSEEGKLTKGRKMRALYDFTGSTDELNFKAGDEIYVLQEVLDDWWMGEANGKRGLFPSNYAVLITGDVRKPPSTSARPSRAPSTTNLFGIASISRGTKAENDESRKTLVNGTDTEFGSNSDTDSDAGAHSHVFADEHRVVSDGLGHLVTAEDNSGTPAKLSPDTSDYHAKLSAALLAQAMTNRTSSDESSTNASSPTKRMPPPPPPRRTPTSGTLAPPPLPARNMSSRSQSTTSLQPSLPPPMPEGRNRKAKSDTSSPFDSESQSINSFDAVALSSSGTKCAACDCQEFHDDPFRGSNVCTNCGHPHI